MITLTATDIRRAAALIAHFGQGNPDGMAAIFAETNETGRLTELVLAVLQFYGEVIPELRTELGMSLLSDTVLRLAAKESA